MSRFMMTTALTTALLAGPALAQDSTGGLFRTTPDVTEIRASEFIGMRVYASEAAVEGEVDMIGDGWEDVGEINDIILDRDGSIEAVLVDVGGFLGMGERQVAMNLTSINFVSDGSTEEENDYFLVVPASRVNLEDAPEYEMRAAMDTNMDMSADHQDVAEADGVTLTDDANAVFDETVTSVDNATQEAAEATEETIAAIGDALEEAGDDIAEGASDMVASAEETMDSSADNMATVDGYVEAKAADITSEELTGVRVYDQNNEWIGEIGELVFSASGHVDAAIVDVGGFMGIGEKPVALTMDKLSIFQQQDGDDLRVYTRLTEAELEALPTYNQ